MLGDRLPRRRARAARRPRRRPGAALVLAVLSLPVAVRRAAGAGDRPAGAPLLAAAGLGSAAAALGAGGRLGAGRAVLGATAWAWLLAGSIALGAGPELGIARPPRRAGRRTRRLAADDGARAPGRRRVAARRGELRARGGRAGMGARAGSCVDRAACRDALGGGGRRRLSLVGNGALGGRQLGIVLAAAVAVGDRVRPRCAAATPCGRRSRGAPGRSAAADHLGFVGFPLTSGRRRVLTVA